MGMKVKQESRVRTFLKRIFRFPKKDKNWKHTRLDHNVEYVESTNSLNNRAKSVSRSRESLVSNLGAQIKDTDCGYGKDWLDIDQSDSREKQHENVSNKNNKKKNKKWQVKVNLNETRLVEVKQYESIDEPEICSQSSLNVNDSKKHKKNKSKRNKRISSQNKDLSNVCNSKTEDQELVDVDLDLVLSSFSNLRKAGQEAEDNQVNERLNRQGALSATDTSQAEAVFEQIQIEPILSLEACDLSILESTPKTPQSTNKKKSRKNKKNKDNKNVVIKPDLDKPRSKSESKKSRNKRKHKGDYQSIEEETYQSIELIISDTRDDLPPLSSADHSHNSKPLKSKKSKKKKNVRRPEDDLEFDISHDLPRRRKHQDLDASDVIADLGTPAESVDQVPSCGKKKMRRRKLKLKFNNDKKKIYVKRYDELKTTGTDEADQAAETTGGASSAREVGRRMWRACKTGLRYMKAGLVYYTKAPANVGNFNPILRRYEDGFNEFGQPGTSTQRARH